MRKALGVLLLLGVTAPQLGAQSVQQVPSARAEKEKKKAAAPGTAEIEQQLVQLRQLLDDQARELEAQRAQIRAQEEKLRALAEEVERRTAKNVAAPPAAEPARAQDLRVVEGQLEEVANTTHELSERVGKVQAEMVAGQKTAESRFKQIGNFHLSGDIRLRYEPFFQGGGFTTRHRERIRARLNLTGKLTDELSGGISLATGSLDDVNSTNQTLTGFFTRKPIGFDRFYLTYKPNWWKALSLTAGKIAIPWYRTPLTIDSDVNPEGIAQTLSFDLKNDVLKNITLVGFQLPINETGSAYDSFVLGGQVQTRWRLTDRATLLLTAAGVNFNRADPIAVAVARGELRPSLPNTNRLRTDASGQVVGFESKYLYLDVIAAVDYKLHPRLPMQVLFNFVNNTRASTSERSGYWGEIQFGRLAEQKDYQFGYTFVRIERDAVLGAFNESDMRASTNVRNHRLNFGYQAYRNVSLNYTLWLGQLANPQANASLVPPGPRPACSTAPFAGCNDPVLRRMQFDLVYKF